MRSKKKITMKTIFIPVAIIVLILAIVAVVLSNGNTSNPGYHVHEDGSTHYDEGYEPTEPTYHVHDDGVTHYDEH